MRADDRVFVFFSKSVCASRASLSTADGAKVAGHLLPVIPQSKSAVQRTRASARRQRLCGLGWQFHAEAGNEELPDAVQEIAITVSVEVFGSLPDGKKSPVTSREVGFRGSMIDLSTNPSNMLLEAFLGHRLEESRREVFQTELDRIQELLEIEPDCRWALLAQGRLQERLASGCAAEEQGAVLSTLAKTAERVSVLDPLRKNFYSDAGAAAKTRQKLQAWLTAGTRGLLDLSGLSMRHLAPSIATFVFGVRVLNMDGNQLSEFGAVLGLISLEDVSLSRNCIRGDVAEVFVLPRLQRVNLSWNDLALGGLQVALPKALQYIDLSGLEGAEGPTVVGRLLAGSTESERQLWKAEVVVAEKTCICRRQ